MQVFDAVDDTFFTKLSAFRLTENADRFAAHRKAKSAMMAADWICVYVCHFHENNEWM